MVYSVEEIMLEANLASDLTRIQTTSDMMVESYLDRMVGAEYIASFFEAGGNALETIKKTLRKH